MALTRWTSSLCSRTCEATRRKQSKACRTANTVPIPSSVRHPEVAGVAVVEQSQRLLPCGSQLHVPCRRHRDAETCRLPMAYGLLRETASGLRTAVCGTARTMV
ncbi:hypothetical protein [Bacteroides heparinolyticus]|uniref:hypothetical protein n=1 Tax=Prevotella heparinolytica TaxID=28113 RepID=UPI0035A1402C